MFEGKMKATDEKFLAEAKKLLEKSKEDNLEHNKQFWNFQVLNWSSEVVGMPIGAVREHRMGFR